MPYTPVDIPRFGGLNLVDDPTEVGAQTAVDLLNVDLDKRGRVRSRDGFDTFTATPAASSLDYLAPFYTHDGTKHLITVTPSLANRIYRAFDTSGAVVASLSGVGIGGHDADSARFGGPGAEVIYVASRVPVGTLSSATVVYKWDGSAWTSAGGVALGGVNPYALEVKAGDNRLVGAFATSAGSRLGFSGAGTPETFGANDWVDLTPGDGERITALVSWRELLIAFKETKFFVFGTTSTDGTGEPVFNYRPVATGVGAVTRHCAVATPSGVFFLSRRGIYKTTGGDPVLVSRAIDPIFRGGASSFYTGGTLNHAAIDNCAFAWRDERLYFAYPSGSATENDRLLVFDPESNDWTLWDIPTAKMASFRIDDEDELVFTYPAAGTNDIGRHSSAYTDDDGAAITSSYQSGFYDLAQPGQDAYTRYTRLWGSGAPTVSVFTDMGSTDANAAAVTLGTAPAVAEGYHAKSYKGRLFSHKLSATTAWSVNRLQHDLAWARP